MDNDDHALDEFSDEEVKNILRDALKVKITERRERPKKNRLNLALTDTLCQFLDCYRVMGYDVDGNPVSLMVFNNKMEKNALDSQFMEEFGNFMVNKKS